MIRNTVITIIILLCMLALIAGFAAFLWRLITLSKRYGEKVREAYIAQITPDPLIIKSSPVLFSIAIINCGVYAGGFYLWRYILKRADWQGFELTIPFILAATGIFILLLIEAISTLCAAAGFFARRLYIEGSHMQYRNWQGRTIAFNSRDVISFRVFRLHSFMLQGRCLLFLDQSGKKRFAVMYLSDYSCALLKKYLEKYVSQI